MFSTSFPASSRTTSCTTTVVTPWITLVLCVTVTTSFCGPSSPSLVEVHTVPGASGNQGLSTVSTKSPGSGLAVGTVTPSTVAVGTLGVSEDPGEADVPVEPQPASVSRSSPVAASAGVVRMVVMTTTLAASY